jgi:LuxR family maltose regulon positive regulatory protein
LILVTAPAGYGKTTIISEWVNQINLPVAWLTLDEGDNDLARFLIYIIAALQTVKEEITTQALEGLPPSAAPLVESILSQLINEITLAAEPVVLILDDYQVIEFQPIHEAVSFLVEHLPSQMHVVISSRVDPPLPLARWRGRRQLAELREADLRFTAEETEEFFRQSMNLELEESDLDVLATHTEGWVAGLQLAGISLKNRSDKSAFIAEFSGSHEFIVDYLTDEVLEKTSKATRDFLLQTSILKQLSAELCDEVTGLGEGRATLEKLRENHLFLMPLDNERRWFRYHALFADLLQKRLLEEQADIIPVLHQRAARWFDQNENPEQAIHHALEAGDYEGALSVIERIVEDTLVRTEIRTFLKWMDAIPAELTHSRPRLLVFNASATLFSGGDLETVENILRDAEKADENDELAGEISAVKAFIATLEGDVEGTIESAQYAIEALPEGNIFLRSLVIGNLSVAYIATGDVEKAADMFTNAAQAGEQAGNHMSTVMALRRLAEMALLSGDLHQAWDICKRGLALAVYPNGKPIPVAGILMAVQGDLLRKWDELEAANDLIQEGIELVLRWSELAAVEIYLYLARVKRSAGEAEAAQRAIDTARQISERNEASRMAPIIISLFQARLWLQLGKLEEVEKWERQYQPFEIYLNQHGYNPKYHHHLLEIEGIAFARLRMAQGQWEEALSILEPLHKAATDLKRHGSVLEILILEAIIFLKKGEKRRAIETLGNALALAEPQGYVRMFIDEGEPMRELLALLSEDMRKRETSDLASYTPKYLNQLLAKLTSETVTERKSKQRTTQGLTEPLSERELEVLRFLPTSLTSTEIAQELYISPNTVRFHIKNIYSKLGVHQRAAAVERVRDLGLI